jgi:PhnB protein
MKKIIPHMMIEDCKEAIEYYQGVFEGEIKNTQLADGSKCLKDMKSNIF